MGETDDAGLKPSLSVRPLHLRYPLAWKPSLSSRVVKKPVARLPNLPLIS